MPGSDAAGTGSDAAGTGSDAAGTGSDAPEEAGAASGDAGARFGGGARGDGELLGLLVLGGMLVLRLVFGRVVFRGRRSVCGGLLLVGQPVLGG